MGRGDFAEGIERLNAVLADARLAPVQRAEALLLQGDALDALDRPADAFAAATKGKALLRAHYAERAAGREREVDKLNRLADWFRKADPAPWRTAPQAAPIAGEARTHVFLVGFPRSGTTLLEQVLAGHPDVVALEEAPTLADQYSAFMTGPDDLARLARAVRRPRRRPGARAILGRTSAAVRHRGARPRLPR